MSRRTHRQHRHLSLLLAAALLGPAACDNGAGVELTPDSGAPQADLAPSADSGLVLPKPTVQQLPSKGPITNAKLAVLDKTVYLSRARGLWTFSGADLQARRLVSFPEERGPSSMVAHQGAMVVTVKSACSDCEGYRILSSKDGGSTWVDLPTVKDKEFLGPPKLFSDGQQLIAETGHEGKIALYDATTKVWTQFKPPLPAGTHHLLTAIIAVRDGTIYANDVYGGGVLKIGLQELRTGQQQWQRIEGLNEWGYTGFVARTAQALTTSAAGIFAKVNGKWTLTHKPAATPHSLIDTGDAFHAFSATEHLTSVDGVTWTKRASLDNLHWRNGYVAHEGAQIAWLHNSAFEVSSDGGTSWKKVTKVVDELGSVKVADGKAYYSVRTQYGPWSLWTGSEWQSGPQLQAPAFTSEGVWSCKVTGCQLFDSKSSEAIREITFSKPMYLSYTTKTSDGLFVATRSRYDKVCEASVSDGVVSVDPATGQVGQPSDDLPYDVVGASCRRYWRPTNLMSVGRTLFVTLDSYKTADVHTYRSDDAGASWTRVSDERLVDIVANASGVYALFADSGLMHSTDDGATFSALAAPGEGPITALAASKSEVFVSRAAFKGDSVWRAGADHTWVPLQAGVDMSFGPVQDLQFRNNTLWIASATDGAWKLSFPAAR